MTIHMRGILYTEKWCVSASWCWGSLYSHSCMNWIILATTQKPRLLRRFQWSNSPLIRPWVLMRYCTICYHWVRHTFGHLSIWMTAHAIITKPPLGAISICRHCVQRETDSPLGHFALSIVIALSRGCSKGIIDFPTMLGYWSKQ